MTNQYISDENKGMMWQILSENGAFNDIPNSNFYRVKTLYETTIVEISQLANLNITERNKLTISTMIKKLPYLKIKQVSKPLEEFQIKLDKEFENKQEEFFKLIKRPSPNEIEFNDKNDEPLNNIDMNNKLNNMMKMRQEELNQIIPDKINNRENSEDNLEKNTLNISDTQNSDKIFHENGSSNDYILGELGNTQIKADLSNQNSQLKKVSFESDNFIGKLKKINKNDIEQKSANDNISLIKILSNQDKILSNQDKILSNQEKILSLFKQDNLNNININ
uniref:Uncharacterized protein n=1 Tax=viral metagenome TaxID=1070528 RepID=A0A6C0AZZ4_9ZZZZ